MAQPRSILAPLSRITCPSIAPTLPQWSARAFSQTSIQLKQKSKKEPDQKKKKSRKTYINHDLRDIQQFSLLDAMHYIRAFEVGRGSTSPKYEMHVRFRTAKSGPSIRNRLRLPHAVQTDLRICVIAAPGSKAAADAIAAGASLVGEAEVFAQIKEGKVDFERCICHLDSFQAMNKAALGRILGPKGLMPSTKTGTVVSNIKDTVRSMVGGSEYRERDAVVRIAIGQLGFTPQEMQTNIRAFMDSVKKDVGRLNAPKEIHEVVLSSTNSPGFSLTGEYKGADSVAERLLSGPL